MEGQSFRQLKALVIDNNLCHNRYEQSLLRSLGVAAKGVRDGRSALDKLARGLEYELDLILIERDLPVINGIEITRRLREIGVKSKILAVTASTEESDRKAFLTVGADKVLRKPLDPTVLTPILGEICARIGYIQSDQ